MADFRTDTSAIKVEPAKGMSLADMLNIQKSSYELSKIKELYPAMIAGEQSRSKSAEIESQIKGIDLEKATQANNERKILQNWASDPTNYLDQNGEIDLQKITHSVNSLAPYTGAETIKKYTDLKTNQASANEAKTKLTDTQRSSLGTVLAGLSASGEQDPKVYIEKVQNWANQFPTDPNAQQLAKSYIGTLGYAKPGPQVLQVAAKAAQEYKGPLSEVVSAGGVPGTFNKATNEYVPFGSTNQGNQPPVNQPTGQPATQPTGQVSFNKPSLITAETPVRMANGVPLFNEQQRDNAKQAREEKSQYSSLGQETEELNKTIDTAEKKLSATAGSAPKRLLRSGGKWIAGNEDLDILTKSLADVTNRQARIMGAGTDAARDANAAASPNVNITEGGLKSILERSKATNTAYKAFLKANEKYEAKRGIDNANANHTQFKNAWASNYDPNIFILQNIHDSNKSEAEKQLEVNKLFKGMSKENIKKFTEKAHNIEALMSGEYQ